MFGAKRKTKPVLVTDMDVSYLVHKETGDKMIRLAGDEASGGCFDLFLSIDNAHALVDTLKSVLETADKG